MTRFLPEALARLAEGLPETSVEYNFADLPVPTCNYPYLSTKIGQVKRNEPSLSP